jgi:lysyl endopeptidase
MKKIYASFILTIFTLPVFGQPSYGGYPLGLGKVQLQKSIPSFKLHPIDHNQLLIEDAQRLAEGEKSLRFGIDVPVNISPISHGAWTVLPSGTAVWQLRIKSTSAEGLNFIFDEFNIPQGAKMFIYSADASYIQGAFTAKNVNKINNFSTLPISSSDVIIEYSEPQNVRGQGQFHLSYIVHNYRSFEKSLKDFGESGSCNNNVVCPEGDAWANEIRSSVVLMTSNNTRFCSGAAVNNTANDLTPYVLTANHCGAAATSIFMFNYYSPTCTPNADGFTTDVVVGCTPRANNAGSDFSLVELSDLIPAEYTAFLSGWSRQETAPATATCIHHPAGDVMKITFNTNLTDIEQYSNADCWHIPTWEDGTTEGGSSGSPLFNENHQIIGQLYGGTASCNNNIDDYFGRFATSWDGSAANRRLKDWLDPQNLDLQTVNGTEASVPGFSIDARMQSIISPIANYCNASSFIPKVKVRNAGLQTLTTFTIVYSLAGGPNQTFDWTGSLATNQAVDVTLPSMVLTAGNSQVFNASISNPNGASDEQPANNSLSISVNANTGAAYSLNIVSDNYPEETRWTLFNTTSNSIVASINYNDLPAGTTSTQFCLADGCYKYTIYDLEGDGICCGFFVGNGSYTLTDSSGIVLGTGGQFSDSANVNFCINDVSIGEKLNDVSTIHVYPNPVNDLLMISVDASKSNMSATVQLFDVQGRVVLTQLVNGTSYSIQTKDIAAGIYWLKYTNSHSNITKKIIISH